VAHELNNPIAYVFSNMGTMEKYLADLFALFEMYQDAEPGCVCQGGEMEKIREFKQQIDLDFLKQDIKSLLAESREGLLRVKKIVLDLKDFSHTGADEEWALADVHAGLDSTLNIVWNELKYKCEVKKEYGDLPQIACLPGQLNQVFMNLLVNAAQAIESKGLITLRTGREKELVWIEMEDTGKGIAPEHLGHIFDPFFTTKPVGQGTGLGLSVSYSIIEKHHGRFKVSSTIGQGTKFSIWLPIDQADAEPAPR
jgi:signal transduction histidine kinase